MLYAEIEADFRDQGEVKALELVTAPDAPNIEVDYSDPVE